jgi:hypothetical protein
VDARAHLLTVPIDGHAGRLDGAPRGLHHLGTDPVTGDQRDAMCHPISPPSSLRCTALERPLWPSRSRRLSWQKRREVFVSRDGRRSSGGSW